jgi:hypothetical protein
MQLPSDLLDRQGEHITNATLGLDDPGRTRINLKLAAEPKDLHVDAAIKHVFVNARGLQQMLPAQRPLWRIDKRK